MNIGFEAKRFFTNFTGLGNYNRFVVNALSEHVADHHYYLYTPRIKDHPETRPITTRSNVSVIGPPQAYQNLHLTSVWRSWGVKNDLTVKKLDIFHGLSQELPVGLPANVKQVVTVHDLIFLRYPRFYNPIDVWIYKSKVEAACKKADKVIAISEQTAADVVSFLRIDRAKIEVVYQGCHPNFSRVTTAEERVAVRKKYNLPSAYILNVGTIEERKNAAMIVKALAVLPRESRIPLVIVGRPTPYLKIVKQCAADLQLEDMVIFLHNASFQDFPTIFQQAKVFVYPSLFEGFGIPLIEAIASGIPVISSKGSCFMEAAGPSALYSDPHRPDELASHMAAVLGNEFQAAQMVTAARGYATRFAPSVIAAHLQACYQSL